MFLHAEFDILNVLNTLNLLFLALQLLEASTETSRPKGIRQTDYELVAARYPNLEIGMVKYINHNKRTFRCGCCLARPEFPRIWTSENQVRLLCLEV